MKFFPCQDLVIPVSLFPKVSTLPKTIQCFGKWSPGELTQPVYLLDLDCRCGQYLGSGPSYTKILLYRGSSVHLSLIILCVYNLYSTYFLKDEVNSNIYVYMHKYMFYIDIYIFSLRDKIKIYLKLESELRSFL